MGKQMEDLHLVFLDSDQEDTRIWSPSNSVFSSKSLFSILIKDLSLTSQVLMSNLWKSVAPPRVLAFS